MRSLIRVGGVVTAAFAMLVSFVVLPGAAHADDPVLQSITVTATTSTVQLPGGDQFTATGTLSDGSTTDLTSSVVWASSDTNVAFVFNDGSAVAHSAGTTDITATDGPIVGHFALTVVDVVSVAVTPSSPTVPAGLSQQFVATGTYSDGSTADVTSKASWLSVTPSVATITSGGLAHGVQPGVSTIGATFRGVFGSTSLTVSSPQLVSISVTPSVVNLAKGTTRQLTATGTYSDGSTQDLTNSAAWSTTDSTVAGVNNGLVSGFNTGTVVIHANVGLTSGSASVTVLAAVLVVLTVTPSAASLPKGLTQQYTATGLYSDGSSANLTSLATWISSNPAVATVTATGVATGVSTGTSQITAALGAVSGFTEVIVSAAVVTSIVVSPVARSVVAGSPAQFTAYGSYSDGTSQNISSSVTWSSSAPAVATVDSAGRALGVSAGTSSITATLGTIAGHGTLTVTAPRLTKITVTPAKPSVLSGASKQFTATGHYSDGTTQDITGSVTWASSDPSVASISATGLASNTHTGSTTITATLATVTGSAILTVKPPALQAITVTPLNRTFSIGTAKQYTAIARYSDGSRVDVTSQVTWASTAPTVADVSNGGVVHAGATGTATITATLGSVTGSTTVTVT